MEIRHVWVIICHSFEDGLHLFHFFFFEKIYSLPVDIRKKLNSYLQATVGENNEIKSSFFFFFFLTTIDMTAETQPPLALKVSRNKHTPVLGSLLLITDYWLIPPDF